MSRKLSLKSTKTTAEKLNDLGGKHAVQDEINRMQSEGSARFDWNWYFANRLTSKVYHELESVFDTDHNTLLQYMAVKTAWEICEDREKSLAKEIEEQIEDAIEKAQEPDPESAGGRGCMWQSEGFDGCAEPAIAGTDFCETHTNSHYARVFQAIADKGSLASAVADADIALAFDSLI